MTPSPPPLTTPQSSEQKRIAEIRERAQKASKGPWVIPSANVFRVVSIDNRGKPVRVIVADTFEEKVYFGRDCIGWPQDSQTSAEEAAANAKLIASARQDIPWLLDQLATLRAERDAMQQKLNAIRKQLSKRRTRTTYQGDFDACDAIQQILESPPSQPTQGEVTR